MSREATLKLINEVFGLAAFEQEIREVIGNTNWEVLALRTREARAALAAPSIDAEAVTAPYGWKLVPLQANWHALENLRELMDQETTFEVVADAYRYVIDVLPSYEPDDAPLTITAPIHDIAHNILFKHTGKEGGCPQIDWYKLRREIADAIELSLFEERQRARAALEREGRE